MPVPRWRSAIGRRLRAAADVLDPGGRAARAAPSPRGPGAGAPSVGGPGGATSAWMGVGGTRSPRLADAPEHWLARVRDAGLAGPGLPAAVPLAVEAPDGGGVVADAVTGPLRTAPERLEHPRTSGSPTTAAPGHAVEPGPRGARLRLPGPRVSPAAVPPIVPRSPSPDGSPPPFAERGVGRAMGRVEPSNPAFEQGGVGVRRASDPRSSGSGHVPVRSADGTPHAAEAGGQSANGVSARWSTPTPTPPPPLAERGGGRDMGRAEPSNPAFGEGGSGSRIRLVPGQAAVLGHASVPGGAEVPGAAAVRARAVAPARMAVSAQEVGPAPAVVSLPATVPAPVTVVPAPLAASADPWPALPARAAAPAPASTASVEAALARAARLIREQAAV